MTPPIALSTKDNAAAQLNAGISASVTSIPLQSGQGSLFPQPYSSTATSGGTSTTLNCTGISATIGGSAAEGKFIWNKTDGSIAIIKTVSTNSITTTTLIGGTDNLWDNSDRWCIDPFVITLAKVTTSAYGVQTIGQKEQCLIIGRSTDTLTVASDGRGYNGTTANTFDTNDYVYLFVTSPIVERLKDVIAEVQKQADTNKTDIATHETRIDNLELGAPFYATAGGSSNAFTVTLSPVPAAYTAGMIVNFKANHSITSTATVNVNSLGAKTIYKLDGATALVANDIKNGQIIIAVYDGTNFQMVSEPGQVAGQDFDSRKTSSSTSSGFGASSTSEVDCPVGHQHDILTTDWTVGGQYLVIVSGTVTKWTTANTATAKIKLGSVELRSYAFGSVSGGDFRLEFRVTCRATGGSGTIEYQGTSWTNASGSDVQTNVYPTTATLDTTATATVKSTIQFSDSNASNSTTVKHISVFKITPA